MRRAPFLWLLLATLVLSTAWFAITPRRAWQRFTRALALGSEAELEAAINYPILRDNLKRDLREAIDLKTELPIPAGDLAGILIDPMVNATITPGGLANLVTGFGMRSDPDGSDAGPFTGTRTRFRYRPPSRVDVRVWPEGGSPVDGGIFTFQRSGLRWRLVRVWSDGIAKLENLP